MLNFDHMLWIYGRIIYACVSPSSVYVLICYLDVTLSSSADNIFILCFFFQGAFTDQHFDQDLNFHATEEDPVTKKVHL